uniref:Uncharacterized protein n=1 Tax=Aureoumbra lagunensis TaxID=44058 RepID=A0A7S3NLZ1_9STRA
MSKRLLALRLATHSVKALVSRSGGIVSQGRSSQGRSLTPIAARRGVVSMNFFSALSGLGTKKEIDYSQLTGLPMSFAKEAAEYALQGIVPTKSKDGHSIAVRTSF